jgi:superfamily I DNA and RNA helicase
MDFSTKPPRARQFDEKITDAVHRLTVLQIKLPNIGVTHRAEIVAICTLLADAAFEGRRCRRAMDEMVQNALQDEIEQQKAATIAAQTASSRAATIIPFPTANAVRRTASGATPPTVA